MKKEAEKGRVRFGTIDTWLLWKLSGGEAYATDFSNASATGIFDPFNVSIQTLLRFVFVSCDVYFVP